jgi:hypothetical protein
VHSILRIRFTEAMYLLSLIALMVSWYGISIGYSLNMGIVILGLSIAFIVCMDFRNLAHVMFMIGFLTFVFMPVISIHDLIYINAYLVLGLCFSTWLFLLLTRNSILPIFRTGVLGHQVPKLIAVACLALILIGLLGVSGLMATPLVLISFFYLIKSAKFGSGLMMLFIMFAYVAVFAIFLWSGFGRLVLASWLMATLWIFWYRYSLPFGKIIVFAPILGGEYVLRALGSTRRAFSMRQQFLDNSVGSDLSPFLLANHIANSERLIDISGLIGQFTLYFLQWVPRELWANKPLGFGFEYTVHNLGPGAIQAGHSIAATHIGEHLYYLNNFGFVTSFFSILLVAASYRFLLKHHDRVPFLSLILAMYLPGFVWGGMVSFSSRVWQAFLILLFAYFLIWLLRVFSRTTVDRSGKKST